MAGNNSGTARYEIKLDISLDCFVRDRLAEFFLKERYTKVLDIATPDGPDIQEYKRDGHLIAISFIEHQAGHVDVVLESESAESEVFFIKAAHWMASDLLATFIRGLPGCKTEGLADQISCCLDELLDRVSVSPKSCNE